MRGETHNKILVYEIELEMLCVWLPGSHLKLEVAFNSFSPSLLHPYYLECEYNGYALAAILDNEFEDHNLDTRAGWRIAKITDLPPNFSYFREK